MSRASALGIIGLLGAVLGGCHADHTEGDDTPPHECRGAVIVVDALPDEATVELIDAIVAEVPALECNGFGRRVRCGPASSPGSECGFDDGEFDVAIGLVDDVAAALATLRFDSPDPEAEVYLDPCACRDY